MIFQDLTPGFTVNTPIWRYIDLAKFFHLITARKLHFTRMDQFKDKFEGSYPLKNIEDWELKYPEVGDFKNWRKFACVSCWYQSEKESAAMWEIYGANGQGMAILSTKERLEASLEWESIIYRNIKYIDFIADKADIHIPHDIFMYKRIEFIGENEFRAAIFDVPKSEEYQDGFPKYGSIDKQEGFPKEGLDIPLNIEALIEKIVLSPYVKYWYRNIVTEILSNYGLKSIPITDSELAADPIYPKQQNI